MKTTKRLTARVATTTRALLLRTGKALYKLAFVLWHLPELWASIRAQPWRIQLTLGCIAAFVVVHMVTALVTPSAG
ncbi:MAG: hypothetical protein IN818_08630 [Cutibacterium sp.]|nr:hypothetical protein [Cutibacterium sp.]